MEITEKYYLERFAKLGAFSTSFTQETDRGAALVAAAGLDAMMEEMLESFSVDHPKAKKILKDTARNFSARLNLCFLFGLISHSEFEIIYHINDIRNKFGHRWDVMNFQTPGIKELVLKLEWRGTEDGIEDPNVALRSRFNYFIMILFSDLAFRAGQLNFKCVYPNRGSNNLKLV